MLVKQVLEKKSRDLITCSASTSFDEAMELLFGEKIGCLPVVDEDNRLVGIASTKDIFRKVHETRGDYHDLTVGDVMTTNVIVGLSDDDVDYVAEVMNKNWIRCMPIVEGDHIVDIVTMRDIIRARVKRTEIENRYLKLYLEGLGTRDRSSDF